MPKRKPAAGLTADPHPRDSASASDPPDKKSKKRGKSKPPVENVVPAVSKRVTRSKSKHHPPHAEAAAAEPPDTTATTAETAPIPADRKSKAKKRETRPASPAKKKQPQSPPAETSSHYFEESGIAGCSDGANGGSQAEIGGEEDSDSDGCGDDWQEVSDAVISTDEEELLNQHHASLPAEGISVELDHPRTKKRKQEKADLERKRANRNKKLVQELRHKSHFLCLFARGFYLNDCTLDQTVQAISLSHISFLCPDSFCRKSPQVNRQLFTNLLKYFTDYFQLETGSAVQDDRHDLQRLISCLTSKSTTSSTVYVMAFISVLRAVRTFHKLKYDVRLCLPIRPVPIKACGLIRSEKEKERAKPVKETKVNGKSGRKSRRGMLSSDDEDDDVIIEPQKVTKKRKSAGAVSSMKAVPLWAEVYLPREGQWVCVEVVNGLFDEPLKIEKTFDEPFNYVIAYDDVGIVKEVSCRYAEKALTPSFNRLRAEKNWVEETISFFKPITKSARESDEDKQLIGMMSSRPMPKTVGEFKSHPLYVLKRHVLVYEAIFPPDAQPVDHFREEPVYSRSCVKPVRSKEFWKRKARVLKPDVYPYKVVKGRKKWDKYAEKYITDIPKELFGFWQTDPYEPPVASGGKVPRNEFGNVELFQPSMLPIGCIHLRLPALARVANKLGIDCVPAVIGFDNAKAGVVPVMDGYVVCEEFKEVLLAAYAEEQDIARRKREAQRVQRVMANWRRLTRALIIRERLKRKYSD
jgi:xeroderma pigmentosum group C-complementing protein